MANPLAGALRLVHEERENRHQEEKKGEKRLRILHPSFSLSTFRIISWDEERGEKPKERKTVLNFHIIFRLP